MSELDNLKAVLTAIAEGYEVEAIDDRYITVVNPDFVPGDWHDPKLFLDVGALFSKAECPDCMGLGARPVSVDDHDICQTCKGSGEIGPLIT